MSTFWKSTPQKDRCAVLRRGLDIVSDEYDRCYLENKELKLKNEQLEEQIVEYKKLIEELAKKVDRVSRSRAKC